MTVTYSLSFFGKLFTLLSTQSNQRERSTVIVFFFSSTSTMLLKFTATFTYKRLYSGTGNPNDHVIKVENFSSKFHKYLESKSDPFNSNDIFSACNGKQQSKKTIFYFHRDIFYKKFSNFKVTEASIWLGVAHAKPQHHSKSGAGRHPHRQIRGPDRVRRRRASDLPD